MWQAHSRNTGKKKELVGKTVLAQTGRRQKIKGRPLGFFNLKSKIMKVETNGDYNPIQLNETTNLSPDGKVLSRSLMLNLRGESPKEVWKTYQELKKLTDGKENEPENKVRDNPGKEKKQNKKEQKKDENVCPECGGLLVEKQGISSKTLRPYHFISCGNWPACNFSKPFISEAEKNIPCDQDLIAVENIPF